MNTRSTQAGVRPVFKVVRPERLELPTPWFEARYSIQLSYGRNSKPYELNHCKLKKNELKSKSFDDKFEFFLGKSVDSPIFYYLEEVKRTLTLNMMSIKAAKRF